MHRRLTLLPALPALSLTEAPFGLRSCSCSTSSDSSSPKSSLCVDHSCQAGSRVDLLLFEEWEEEVEETASESSLSVEVWREED
jgi:hypothetical protein